MENKDVLKFVDHTLLNQDATWEDIKTILDDAMKYNVASACIPPCFVKEAKTYVKDRLPICTVIGFPNGYNTTEVKVFETKDAIKNGADEIDMVVNIGMIKEKRYDDIKDEIMQIHKACEGRILKVIIETCLLSEIEKIKMSEIVSLAKAEYIKTSTGFSKSGANFKDVELLRESVEKHVKVKAAGGISSFDDAKNYIRLGAERLGTSRLVKIMKNEEVKGEY